MYPVIVALCMMIAFGEKRTWIDFLAIAGSFFGVYLLASGDSIIVEGGNTQLGLICSMISAFSFAAYYILMKRLKADKTIRAVVDTRERECNLLAEQQIVEGHLGTIDRRSRQ